MRSQKANEKIRDLLNTLRSLRVSPKNALLHFSRKKLSLRYILYLINNEQVMLTSQFSLLVSSFDAWRENQAKRNVKNENWLQKINLSLSDNKFNSFSLLFPALDILRPSPRINPCIDPRQKKFGLLNIVPNCHTFRWFSTKRFTSLPPPNISGG
jgi:uncharacterized protein YpiB (UPF0302 family)